MGWLDIIFGKGTSKKAAKVTKVIAGATAAPRKERAKKPKQSIPKVEWLQSEKGNDVAEIDDLRVTIFRQDGGWNYCISEIVDEDDEDDGSPDFGPGFTTKAQAKKAALEIVDY